MDCKKSAAAAAVERLFQLGMTLSCAESCTGGLIAKKITDISGSSEVFPGGVVSYSCDVKESLLGVSGKTIETFGVVSENVAAEMSEGARRVCGSSAAVSTTGVAGPTGGTPECPVGTVCFGLSVEGEKTKTFTKHFGEHLTRDEIREAAADFALGLVCDIERN